MKGIVLAGGSGTRLYPLNISVSKQLLPIYDKPMIYYPLAVLMLAGIRDILIITTPRDLDSYRNLLGDGGRFGVFIQYAIQKKPEGLAQAFTIGADFIGDDSVSLILGDNVFFGPGFGDTLKKAYSQNIGATIFAYRVKDPERFGVVEMDDDGNVLSIEEKPRQPLSSYAATGLYIFNNQVVDLARRAKPSARGELEITDILETYRANRQLKAVKLGRGFAWLDTGTHESLLQASQFVETIQKRQGFLIACLEEIAMQNHWLNDEQIKSLANEESEIFYHQYVRSLINEK